MEGMHPMLLHDLLQASGLAVDLSSLANIPITAIHEDSRQVVPGSLFIARPGTAATVLHSSPAPSSAAQQRSSPANRFNHARWHKPSWRIRRL